MALNIISCEPANPEAACDSLAAVAGFRMPGPEGAALAACQLLIDAGGSAKTRLGRVEVTRSAWNLSKLDAAWNAARSAIARATGAA